MSQVWGLIWAAGHGRGMGMGLPELHSIGTGTDASTSAMGTPSSAPVPHVESALICQPRRWPSSTTDMGWGHPGGPKPSLQPHAPTR